MTRLLLSVRDVDEAAIALSAGADILDLKEPGQGSLGAVPLPVLHNVIDRVAGRVPVSAALGELLDARPDDAARLPATLAYAKLGLAGCALQSDWAPRWQRVLAALPAGVAPVAVVYADHAQVAAPEPAEVLTLGARLGCRAALVDTCDKTRGGLLDLWSLEQVATFVAAARQSGMLAVLGGSLDTEAIERLLPLRPEVVAVRGAACEGDRTGRLSLSRATDLAALVGAGASCKPHATARR